jgi:MSHA biogenesis protein MshQ
VRTNQARFHDAGSLTVRVVDKTFSAVDDVANEQLGIDPSTTWVTSNPIDIGRFVPDSFAVTPTNDPVFWTQGDDHNNGMATCGPRSFTYIGQPFGYETAPEALISARSANGAITPAYRNELWKLSADWVDQDYTYNTDPADAAELDTSFAPLVAGNANLVSNNDGTGTLAVNPADRLSFIREPLLAAGDPPVVEEPPLPFDAFITLTLSVYDDAEAGFAGNARINTGTPAVFDNIDFDSGNEFRYGRMRLINSVGSELEDLLVPYRLQTWQDLGNDVRVWVTESADNCTGVATGDFSVLNIQDTGIGGLDPQLTAITDPAAAGIGDLTFGAQEPQVTGSFEVLGDGIPSWLWYNWNNSATGDEEGPSAKAAFGVNEGNPRRIFRTQSFTPRGSGQN